MKKRGISLIVLVITIIVIIILAGAIILNLTKNNPIESARKAKFLNDIDAFKSELSLYELNKMASTDGNYNPKLLNADKSGSTENGDPTNTNKKITDIITSMDNTNYPDKLEVIAGELVYVGDNENESNWSDGVIEVKDFKINVSVVPDTTYFNGTITLSGIMVDSSKIEYYRIYLSQTSGSHGDTPVQEITEKSATVNFNITEGISPNQTYYITVELKMSNETDVRIKEVKVNSTVDNVAPNTPQIAVPSSSGTTTISPVVITLIDNNGGSGINKTLSKYIINQISANYSENDNIWQSGATNFTPDIFIGDVATLTLTVPSDGEYYVHVLAVDNAGNMKSAVSSKVTVTTQTIIDTGYNATQGLNGPVLKNGMTPVKWNGSAWVTTTADDTTWYNYANKQWANVITADGSMWVWIPRYEYKITTPHTNTAQTIAINFKQGTQTSVTSGYILHPGFTFGNTELTGIWVAKFEASGTVDSIEIKPNVTALNNVTINQAFIGSRNMETNNKYGWGTSGNSIDTHLIKNTEWGTVSYLSSSIYGKTGQVWINPDNTHLTGRAGTSEDATETATTYPYDNSTYGINASTTGNVYGIYDMSGGSWEYSAAYLNNGNSSLTTYGSSLLSADNKYKEVYSVGSTDGRGENYEANSTKKGDAVYETSSTVTEIPYNFSWYGDHSSMPYSVSPFFVRGGVYNIEIATNITNSGMFAFSRNNGDVHADLGFRPVIAISDGL